MKEKVKKQIEIVNGDSREAIEDLINSNPRLSSESQLAIIEKQDKNLFKSLMSSQRRICDKAIIKIFTMSDITWVKLFGRYCRSISESAHKMLCKTCMNYAERYVEYDRQRYCEEVVEALSQTEIDEYSEQLEAIYGEGNRGYSIRHF